MGHRDIGRTFSSGHQNRLKKQKLSNFLNTQRGAMDKFNIVTFSLSVDVDVHKNDNITDTIVKTIVKSNASSSCPDRFLSNANDLNIGSSSSNIDLQKNENISNCTEIISCCSNDGKTMYLPEDLRDPSRWPEIATSDIKHEILEIGPIRITNIDFPVKSYENNRTFLEKYFIKE